MFFNKFHSFVLVFTGFLLFIGCREPKPEGFPKVYSVQLALTQEGQPLADADVTLYPVDLPSSSLIWAVGGKSDQNGNVELRTHGRYIGAPAGKFKVVIFKEVKEGLAEYAEAMNRHDTAAAAKIDVKIYSCVKLEYNLQDKTPAEIEITPSSKIITVDAGPAVKLQQEFLR